MQAALDGSPASKPRHYWSTAQNHSRTCSGITAATLIPAVAAPAFNPKRATEFWVTIAPPRNCRRRNHSAKELFACPPAVRLYKEHMQRKIIHMAASSSPIQANWSVNRAGDPARRPARRRIPPAGSHRTACADLAGRLIPLSYKAAWDAVDAMNNMADSPLVERSVGNRQGGGTTLTHYGRQMVALYRAMEKNTRKPWIAYPTVLARSASTTWANSAR